MSGKTSLAGGAASGRDVFGSLERDVLSGRYPPGSKLPSERALSARLGVGRPLVREALRGLVERGLITVSPGRGAFVVHAESRHAVAPLDVLYRRQSVTPRDVVEARLMLESRAVQLAAKRASVTQVAAIRYALEASERQGHNLLAQARWDVALHVLLVGASGNLVIETMYRSITLLVFEIVIRSLADPAVARAGIPFHRKVVDAIEARDPDAARRAIESHLAAAGRLYGADLDRNLDVVAGERLAAFGAAGSVESAFDLESLERAIAEAVEVGSQATQDGQRRDEH